MISETYNDKAQLAKQLKAIRMKSLILLFIFQSCFQKERLPERYDIFLCVGQSNMLGIATIETQDSNSGAWLWNDTGWEKADGHLNRYSNIANVYGGLSMINSFGKEAARHIRGKVGLVVNARGSTSIGQWDTIYLAMSIQRTKEAEQSNPNNRVRAVILHQGEFDMFNASGYRPSFKSFRTQVDTLLGYQVPIIIGGLSTVHYYYRVLNDTFQQLALDIHDTYFVSSDSLTTTDGTHFDSESCRMFGLRYWERYKLTN